MANDTFCVTLLFLWKTGLLRHNFGSRSAKKSIKIQKDADFSLVSNKTWAKNVWLGWRPGPDKRGQKFENTLTCDVTHREL